MANLVALTQLFSVGQEHAWVIGSEPFMAYEFDSTAAET
jgi:hypothetical protein